MLTIDVIDPQTGAVVPHPISPGQVGSWRPLPGAEGVRVVLRDGGQAVFHAEAPTPGGLPAVFEIQAMASQWQALAAGGRPLLPLPPSDVAAPSILQARALPAVDVFFLIDGTMLHPKGAAELEPYLGTADWRKARAQFPEFCSQLGVPELRAGVGAFGDEPLAAGRADGYLLHPRVWNLTSPAAAERDWNELRAADGGDFVDALADGLHRCRSLPWNSVARKMVVLVGDSPGYSVLDAARGGVALADGHLRQHDVYEEAVALHDLGVEIATIFHTPGAETLREQTTWAAELVDYSREQYRRLASLPEWCLSSPGWNAAQFAAAWKKYAGLVARGVVPPLAPMA